MLKISELKLLLSDATQRKFVLALIGSVLTALADAAGVLAILPLMQLLTGSPINEGLLGSIDNLLGGVSAQTLAISLAVFTFGAFAFKGLATVFFKWWLLGFVSSQEAETSERLLRYYLAAPYGLHLRRNSADLLRTLNDAVRNVYTQQTIVGAVTVASEFFTILAVATILLVLTPIPATLLLVYFTIAGGLLYGTIRPMTHRAGERMLASYVHVYQSAMHALGGIKEIKVRHKNEFFLETYRGARIEYAGSQRLATFFGELPRYVMEILFILGIGSMTVFVFVTSPSAESIGVLAILAAAGFRLLPSAVRMLGAMNIIRFGRPSLDLVLSELRDAQASERIQMTDPVRPASDDERRHVRQGVAFEHVTFTHEGQLKPAVSNVSFEFPAGNAISLVGPSGAGKSTIVDLLLGLQSPQSGRISVNGKDISSFLSAWQRSLGLVPQEVFLLDASLRANIAFGEHEAEIDEDQLAEAIASAQLEDFIGALPEGLETKIGERGARLSGGQRQRIGIARALYTRPDLLILDEATSALDNETERRISETISRLHGSVTIVIVAHRLSTVRGCDKIVFVEEGRVAATGDFDELQVLSSEFARLVELGRLA